MHRIIFINIYELRLIIENNVFDLLFIECIVKHIYIYAVSFYS
jgi:hypothetical protein